MGTFKCLSQMHCSDAEVSSRRVSSGKIYVFDRFTSILRHSKGSCKGPRDNTLSMILPCAPWFKEASSGERGPPRDDRDSVTHVGTTGPSGSGVHGDPGGPTTSKNDPTSTLSNGNHGCTGRESWSRTLPSLGLRELDSEREERTDGVPVGPSVVVVFR